MNKNRHIIVLLIAIFAICAGCAHRDAAEPAFSDKATADEATAAGVPRLVISGKVSTTDNKPLQGIYVSIFGVRQPMEEDIKTYNYAISDELGEYTIIRYRGRELPTELTVVASDSTGLYQEQSRICEITYDSVFVEEQERKMPFNGFVTADFVLSQ